MQRTRIPWCSHVWNPIEGCNPISEGCQNCFAASFAHRFGRHWGSPRFRPEKLGEPARTKKPARVFVCSTSDFFHDCCEENWQDTVTLTMAREHRHTFLLLTKRPQNIQRWIWRQVESNLWPLSNIWIGCTAENQARFNERWKHMRPLGFLVRFVSVEPMLGPVTLPTDPHKPDWVICGPENGPHKRPCDPQWIDDLAAQSPCFFDKSAKWKRREFPVVDKNPMV